MKYHFAPILLIVCLLNSITVFSQVTLTGNAPTYAGREIVFKTFADPFTESEKELGKCKVAADGNFSTTLPVLETTYVFSHLGIFKGSIFV